jgi:hypothetical protein
MTPPQYCPPALTEGATIVHEIDAGRPRAAGRILVHEIRTERIAAEESARQILRERRTARREQQRRDPQHEPTWDDVRFREAAIPLKV